MQFVQVGYDPDISTARTLTLVAMILQIAFFIIGITFVSFFFAFIFGATGTAFPLLGIFAFAFGIAFLISLIWIGLDYFLVYRNLDSPTTMPTAKTPALVLGILQLLFGGTMPGILLIVAYMKLGDSMRRRGQMF